MFLESVDIQVEFLIITLIILIVTFVVQNQQNVNIVNNNNNNNENINLENQQRFNDECPVCLERDNHPSFVANCRHYICSTCILQLWQVQRRVQIHCPICRRKIYYFHQFQVQDIQYNEVQNNRIHEVQRYNYHFAQNRSLFDKLKDLPFYFSRFSAFIFSREGFKFLLKYVLFSMYFLPCIIYILSPIDIIPEAVFGVLGLIDDIILGIFALFSIINIFRQMQVQVERQQFEDREFRQQQQQQQQQ